MAGLVSAISVIGVVRPPDRDRRDRPGVDELAAGCPSYRGAYSGGLLNQQGIAALMYGT